MDNIQIKAIDAIRAHKDLITDRSKFKGMLADYLVDDKVYLNVLMNAYDEKFPIKIKNATDRTLLAIQHIKLLTENYGISERYAKWSIITWCAVLGFDEITKALDSIETSFGENNTSIAFSKFVFDESADYTIGLGTYCAGVDFPAGTISIKAEWEDRETIFYEVSESLEFSKEWTGSFIDNTYVKMKAGEFILLEMENRQYSDSLISITARKVAE